MLLLLISETYDVKYVIKKWSPKNIFKVHRWTKHEELK